MCEEGLDYYLCHDPANIFYLTNFANFVHERPFILLVPQRGSPIFLTPKLEESRVPARSVGPLELLHYSEFPAPHGKMRSDRLRQVLASTHRVGVETQCPLAVVRAVPGEPVPADIVEEARMIGSR
jgi:Xaa-Pro dipeptidase